MAWWRALWISPIPLFRGRLVIFVLMTRDPPFSPLSSMSLCVSCSFFPQLFYKFWLAPSLGLFSRWFFFFFQVSPRAGLPGGCLPWEPFIEVLASPLDFSSMDLCLFPLFLLFFFFRIVTRRACLVPATLCSRCRFPFYLTIHPGPFMVCGVFFCSNLPRFGYIFPSGGMIPILGYPSDPPSSQSKYFLLSLAGGQATAQRSHDVFLT